MQRAWADAGGRGAGRGGTSGPANRAVAPKSGAPPKKGDCLMFRVAAELGTGFRHGKPFISVPKGKSADARHAPAQGEAAADGRGGRASLLSALDSTWGSSSEYTLDFG